MEPYGEHDRRLPGEIVEIYRQPDPREVVETYIRPLPGVSRVRTARPLRRKKKGLWIFLAVLAGTAVLAAAAWLLESRRPYQDRCEQYYEDFLPEETGGEITIPTFPTGQGIELPVLREHGGAMTAQEIYRQVNPAVVTVMADLGEHMSVGTGVIFTGATSLPITMWWRAAGTAWWPWTWATAMRPAMWPETRKTTWRC